LIETGKHQAQATQLSECVAGGLGLPRPKLVDHLHCLPLKPDADGRRSGISATCCDCLLQRSGAHHCTHEVVGCDANERRIAADRALDQAWLSRRAAELVVGSGDHGARACQIAFEPGMDRAL